MIMRGHDALVHTRGEGEGARGRTVEESLSSHTIAPITSITTIAIPITRRRLKATRTRDGRRKGEGARGRRDDEAAVEVDVRRVVVVVQVGCEGDGVGVMKEVRIVI